MESLLAFAERHPLIVVVALLALVALLAWGVDLFVGWSEREDRQ